MTDEGNRFEAGLSQNEARALTDEEWEEQYKRPNALLTDTDRRFLLGRKQYKNERSVSERRGFIRQRLLHGIIDIPLLAEITDRQRGKLLDELQGNVAPGVVEFAAMEFIALMYEFTDGDTNWLDERIKGGVRRGYVRMHADEDLHGRPQITTETTVKEPWNIDEIEERFRSSGPNALSAEEKWILHTERGVPTDDLKDINPTFGDADTDRDMDTDSDADTGADVPDSPFTDQQ
jgi:hypothetical protein